SALAHAHERGIVHRDVKPSNLLLDGGGTVWITDFGLAKTEEDAQTRTGDILGTIRYMSPERFQGKCDPRADIYALGMTLDELKAEQQAIEDLYASHVAQANASRFSRQVGQRFDTIKAVRKAAELVRERGMPAERLDDLRSLAIAALALPDLRTLKSWEGRTGEATSWVMDDQARLYARWKPDEGISLCRLDTDEMIARMQGGEFLRFSPGGRFLIACGNYRFRVWDVSHSEPRLVHQEEEYDFAFHPDGRHLLISGRDGSLWRYDLHAPGEAPAFFVSLRSHKSMWRDGGLVFDP